MMEKKKHNYIKVGQDSAITHEFNSANISACKCIINILGLVNLFICIYVIRVPLLDNEPRGKNSSLSLLKKGSCLHKEEQQSLQKEPGVIPAPHPFLKGFEQPEFAEDRWWLLNM